MSETGEGLSKILPKDLDKAASELLRQAKQIGNLTRDVQKIIDETKSVFEGKRAIAFYTNYSILRGKLADFQPLLTSFANNLAETADKFVQVDGETTSKSGNEVGEIIKQALPKLAAATAIGSSLKAGTAYAGEVIINLPEWLRSFKGLREIRELAGLSGHLNHFNVANLPSIALKSGAWLSIPEILYKVYTDVGNYQGTQLASAVVVDTFLTLVPVGASFVVSQGTTLMVAAIGTAIVPGIGTAAGFVVGTAIVSLGFGVATSIATQGTIEHFAVREPLIDLVDNCFQSTIREIGSTFQSLFQPEPAY